MIYLSSFKVSEHRVNNPNLYPYNVFRNKEIYPFIFAPITIFYGNNGCGKSNPTIGYENIQRIIWIIWWRRSDKW